MDYLVPNCEKTTALRQFCVDCLTKEVEKGERPWNPRGIIRRETERESERQDDT